jgi:hypothetical protein
LRVKKTLKTLKITSESPSLHNPFNEREKSNYYKIGVRKLYKPITPHLYTNHFTSLLKKMPITSFKSKPLIWITYNRGHVIYNTRFKYNMTRFFSTLPSLRCTNLRMLNLKGTFDIICVSVSYFDFRFLIIGKKWPFINYGFTLFMNRIDFHFITRRYSTISHSCLIYFFHSWI